MKKQIRFSKEAQRKLKEILSIHAKIRKESSILPVLSLAQDEFGYISQEVEEYVADLLDIPVVKIHEVVTFYTLYNKEEVGKYLLQVCRNLPCALSGCGEIIDYLCEKLGIRVGETTPDKKFTLVTVECLGACDTGPNMMINDVYYRRLSKERIDEILDELE